MQELAKDLGAHPRLRILESYGSTELKWAFIECRRGSGMHLNPKYYFWELLDPTSKEPVSEGKPGVLTFSHVGWHGTVLTRFYTGDLVKGGMHWERCPHCGYTFATIKGPICRADKDFTKIKGTLVDLSELRDTVRDTPGVRNFQIHIETDGEAGGYALDVMTVHVLALPGHRADQIEALIRRRVKEATEVTPNRICFESDVEAFENRLFARTGIKAEHVVEKRPLHSAGL
jgi:phenylacetate-CoA ligase